MSILSLYEGPDYHNDTVRVCILDQGGVMLINRDVDNGSGAVRDLVIQHGFSTTMGIEACCGAAGFAAELDGQTEWSVRLAHVGYARFKKTRETRPITVPAGCWLIWLA